MLQNSLHLINFLPLVYCLLIAGVHSSKSSNSTYIQIVWANSNICKCLKVVNIVSVLLSNYIILLNAVNFLVLTRLSLVRAPLSLTEVCNMLGVRTLVAVITGVVWVQLMGDQESLCFPMFYGKSRGQDIAVAIYMVINLFMAIAVPFLYRYIGRYVAACAKRANQRKSSRGISEQSILSACTMGTSWSCHNILNWLDFIFDDVQSIDIRFFAICSILSVQTHLCWAKHIRKFVQDMVSSK